MGGFSEASGMMVETQHDFGLSATGPRQLAQPGPLKALTHTDPTVEKWLMGLSQSVVHTLQSAREIPTSYHEVVINGGCFNYCVKHARKIHMLVMQL